jgi:hypothetical protein
MTFHVVLGAGSEQSHVVFGTGSEQSHVVVGTGSEQSHVVVGTGSEQFPANSFSSPVNAFFRSLAMLRQSSPLIG